MNDYTKALHQRFCREPDWYAPNKTDKEIILGGSRRWAEEKP